MAGEFLRLTWSQDYDPTKSVTDRFGRDLIDVPSYRDREHTSSRGDAFLLVPLNSVEAAAISERPPAPEDHPRDVRPVPAPTTIAN
jgi:hypothetical protein